MTAELIAVTGATGAVGGRVAARLAALGLRQRLVVRDPSRAPVLDGAEVRQARGYGFGDDMREAFGGATTVFLVPAAEAADRVEQHLTAVDAAVAAGAGRIVYLSVVGAAPDATFTLARHHWATEERIRASGVPFTFPRMNLYMDFLPSMVGADGAIRGPAGGGRLAALLREDVAAAVSAVLSTPGHDGATYDLTGREAFTLTEAAAVMAAATGCPIRFVDETDDEAYASRVQYGAPDWEVDGWVSSYQAIRDGSFAAVTSAVRDLTGRDPTTLAEHMAANPSSLVHVTDPV